MDKKTFEDRAKEIAESLAGLQEGARAYAESGVDWKRVNAVRRMIDHADQYFRKLRALRDSGRRQERKN